MHYIDGPGCELCTFCTIEYFHSFSAWTLHFTTYLTNPTLTTFDVFQTNKLSKTKQIKWENLVGPKTACPVISSHLPFTIRLNIGVFDWKLRYFVISTLYSFSCVQYSFRDNYIRVIIPLKYFTKVQYCSLTSQYFGEKKLVAILKK